MNTPLLLPSPPRTLSRCSSTSLTLLSPLTQMTTLSLPQSPSPVDWTMMDQLLYGHLPPPTSCRTLLTFPTTTLCRQATQRYAFPVPLEDPTVQNSINHDVWSATPSAKNPADPPINASVNKKPKQNNTRSLSTSLREMRPSTIWGQYLHTQGGQKKDPAYPASSTRKT